MTPPLPEPLMLNVEPHYTARQIAEMRLPGLSGTRRGVNAMALSESWTYRRRLSGRGGGKVYPLEALPGEAVAKMREKHILLLLGADQRARVEAKAEAVRLWRCYRWHAPPGRYPSPTPARLSAHSGRPVRPERRSGRAKPCQRSPPPPCTPRPSPSPCYRTPTRPVQPVPLSRLCREGAQREAAQR